MKLKKLLLILLSLSLLVACSSDEQVTGQGSEDNGQSQESQANSETSEDQIGGEVNISAAASLQYSIEEITEKYTEEYGTEFKLNFGGSGALREQIEAGAKADIFISANQNHMDTLVEGGYINEDSLTDLLVNDVVLIVPEENAGGVTQIEDLVKDSVEVVALGEEESVPVGEYSQQILDYYGISEEVNSKATYGTDVTQVLNWVNAGEADAGFVYRTDAMQGDNIEVVEAAPKESHDPVIYPAAMLEEAENTQAGKVFFEYLQSDQAMAVFEKYGFGKAE